VNRRSAVLAGALAGLTAGFAFAGAHAFIITPIWSRMFGGLVFGTIAGTASGWAYAEIQPESSLRSGLLFGILLWLSIVPVTLVNSGLRTTGFAHAHETITDTIGIVFAIAGGVTLGWLRARRRRAMIACAVAAVVLTLAMGGPVPIVNGVRPVEILFAVLVASLVGGAVVGMLEPSVARALNGTRPTSR
jgi:uncharacterized membrane protein